MNEDVDSLLTVFPLVIAVTLIVGFVAASIRAYSAVTLSPFHIYRKNFLLNVGLMLLCVILLVVMVSPGFIEFMNTEVDCPTCD